MMMEAIARLDESLVHALSPPCIWGALHTTSYERIFIVVAMTAMNESRKWDTLFWLCSCMQVSARYSKDGDDTELADWGAKREESVRRRVAWVCALRALEAETGAALTAAARIFSGSHMDTMLEVEEKFPGLTIAFDEELDALRQLWNAGTQNSPGAPRARPSAA